MADNAEEILNKVAYLLRENNDIQYAGEGYYVVRTQYEQKRGYNTKNKRAKVVYYDSVKLMKAGKMDDLISIYYIIREETL